MDPLPTLSLRDLQVNDQAAAMAAHRELAEDNFPFLLDQRDGEDWSTYVQRLSGWPQGVGLPQDWTSGTLLVAMVRGTLVGRLSLRHELTTYLAEVGGHIGYAVRPAYRRQGFATEMLRQSLGLAAGLGLERVLITCDTDNTASAGVIEGCGGRFDRLALTDDGVTKRRYWITV